MSPACSNIINNVMDHDVRGEMTGQNPNPNFDPHSQVQVYAEWTSVLPLYILLSYEPYLFVALANARRTAFGLVLGANAPRRYNRTQWVPLYSSVLEYRPMACGGSFSFLLRSFFSSSLARGITVPSPIFYHRFARSACAPRHALLEFSAVLL